jgi:hypothetical protein
LIFHSLSANDYNYTILYNASYDAVNLLAPTRKPENRNELQILVDKCIFRLHRQLGGLPAIQPQLSYSTRLFPQLGYKGGANVVDQQGISFYYCGVMFQSIILLYNLCAEKDLKLRQGLKMIGLRDWAYWWSWFITALVLNLIAVGVLLATGKTL